MNSFLQTSLTEVVERCHKLTTSKSNDTNLYEKYKAIFDTIKETKRRLSSVNIKDLMDEEKMQFLRLNGLINAFYDQLDPSVSSLNGMIHHAPDRYMQYMKSVAHVIAQWLLWENIAQGTPLVWNEAETLKQKLNNDYGLQYEIRSHIGNDSPFLNISSELLFVVLFAVSLVSKSKKIEIFQDFERVGWLIIATGISIGGILSIKSEELWLKTAYGNRNPSLKPLLAAALEDISRFPRSCYHLNTLGWFMDWIKRVAPNQVDFQIEYSLRDSLENQPFIISLHWEKNN